MNDMHRHFLASLAINSDTYRSTSFSDRVRDLTSSLGTLPQYSIYGVGTMMWVTVPNKNVSLRVARASLSTHKG